jgi:glycerate kinase
MPEIKEAEFIVACDVSSPLYGPKGAAYVFAPQKGADAAMVEELDRGLRHFADIMQKCTGLDVADMPGAGAAGGLGAAFKAFLNADLKKGADMVLDAVRFDEQIVGADLVITGEGKIDSQTMAGKLPAAVAERAAAQNVPVVAICGSSDIDTLPGFHEIYQVTPESMPLHEAMNPETAGRNIIRTIEHVIAAQ